MTTFYKTIYPQEISNPNLQAQKSQTVVLGSDNINALKILFNN